MKMDQVKYYQVGEVSKICHIPIRTLHYYNDIGLLVPDKVSEESGYRYYSHSQLQIINVIKFYKEAGFSLKEIKELIKREDMAYNQQKIEEKCQEIDRRIGELMILKNKLRYSHWDVSNRPLEGQVVFKAIPFQYVAFSRYTAACNQEEFILRYLTLNRIIENQGLHMTGPMMAIYYDDYREFDYARADIEVCASIVKPIEENKHVRVWGGFKAATLLHYGSYKSMPMSYQRLLDAMEEKGYSYKGQAIESYIVDCTLTLDEESYVTELIIPLL